MTTLGFTVEDDGSTEVISLTDAPVAIVDSKGPLVEDAEVPFEAVLAVAIATTSADVEETGLLIVTGLSAKKEKTQCKPKNTYKVESILPVDIAKVGGLDSKFNSLLGAENDWTPGADGISEGPLEEGINGTIEVVYVGIEDLERASPFTFVA